MTNVKSRIKYAILLLVGYFPFNFFLTMSLFEVVTLRCSFLISFGLIPRPLAAYLYSFGIDTPSACGGVVHYLLRQVIALQGNCF
jgi:hypothetical protein